jgi:hypothetical protein
MLVLRCGDQFVLLDPHQGNAFPTLREALEAGLAAGPVVLLGRMDEALTPEDIERILAEDL